jgi:hypothetical protein
MIFWAAGVFKGTVSVAPHTEQARFDMARQIPRYNKPGMIPKSRSKIRTMILQLNEDLGTMREPHFMHTISFENLLTFCGLIPQRGHLMVLSSRYGVPHLGHVIIGGILLS